MVPAAVMYEASDTSLRTARALAPPVSVFEPFSLTKAAG
jgi:hypothetical protein